MPLFGNDQSRRHRLAKRCTGTGRHGRCRFAHGHQAQSIRWRRITGKRIDNLPLAIDGT